AKDCVFLSFIEREGKVLEISDDLVHVFDDTWNGLMFVQHSVDADAPHRRSSKRGQQHPPHRVAECVTESPLERLEIEFGCVLLVVALRRFDELRADKSLEIYCVCHCLLIPQRPAPPVTRGKPVTDVTDP